VSFYPASFRPPRKNSFVRLLLLSVFFISAQGGEAKEREKALPRPEEWTESVLKEDRARMLAEFQKRKIIDSEAVDWTPEQYTELLRMREAEAMGAFDLIRSKLGTLRGFAAEHPADGYKKLWLTVAGYHRFIFFHSQDARAYFEKKGSPAKFTFQLRTLAGKRIFTDRGILTQEGIAVFGRIKRGLAVYWRHFDGRLNGTRRPPASLLAGDIPGENDEKALKSNTISKKEDDASVRRVAELLRSGYVEISFDEKNKLVKAANLSEKQLIEDSSLQIIATGKKIFYLLSPSDPLMASIGRIRGMK